MKLPYAIKQKMEISFYEYPYNFFYFLFQKILITMKPVVLPLAMPVHVDDDIDHTTWQWHHQIANRHND